MQIKEKETSKIDEEKTSNKIINNKRNNTNCPSGDHRSLDNLSNSKH